MGNTIPSGRSDDPPSLLSFLDIVVNSVQLSIMSISNLRFNDDIVYE